MDMLWKIRRNTGRSALILVDMKNLKVIALKRATIWLRKVVKIYRRLYGGQSSP